MKMTPHIIETPWDTKAFGIKTYEIQVLSKESLEEIRSLKGHFTVRVTPLSSKRLLHEYGFYYCDTLIEPFCTSQKFISFPDPAIKISASIDKGKLMDIAHGLFVFGRFHRDFTIDKELADLRYDNWLKDLYNSENVLEASVDGQLAGFFGMDGSKIVLNALDAPYRGKRKAKYFWSALCQHLFDAGHSEITSSISAANVAILNVYSSLGFSFRNPQDIYHRNNS